MIAAATGGLQASEVGIESNLPRGTFRFHQAQTPDSKGPLLRKEAPHSGGWTGGHHAR